MSKEIKKLEEYFEKLRFHPCHHLELGDIRLTIGQQEYIIKMMKKAIKGERKRN